MYRMQAIIEDPLVGEIKEVNRKIQKEQSEKLAELSRQRKDLEKEI